MRIMGTIARVVFYESDPARNKKAAQTVWRQFDRLSAACNVYSPASELSRLQRMAAGGKPVQVSPVLWELFTWSDIAFQQSDNLFDPTARPIIKLWGIYRHHKDELPSKKEIQEALQYVGWKKLILDRQHKTVSFAIPQLKIDFGGIAKGFALDLARRELNKIGIQRGLIDLGGNIMVLQQPPPGRKHYWLGIRNPLKPNSPSPIITFRALDCATATSGNYERFVMIHGKRYGHIINPKTGWPIEGILSATVITRKGVVSDFLSTTVYLTKGKTLPQLKKEYPELHALLIFPSPTGNNPDIRFFPAGDPDFWDFSDLPEGWQVKPMSFF
ncbi:MAG: FAD:protein FMN transferase [Lentisphaerae bacterium]|nr:MAG: FAD:protein FMN transferase [Lentisphaerota bacterium]